MADVNVVFKPAQMSPTMIVTRRARQYLLFSDIPSSELQSGGAKTGELLIEISHRLTGGRRKEKKGKKKRRRRSYRTVGRRKERGRKKEG